MSERVPEGWEIRTSELIFDRLKIPKVYNRNDVLNSGKFPIIDQSENGEIGFIQTNPDFLCNSEKPIITFANHTCAVRRMTRPFGVIQNVFPLVNKKDTNINFIFQILKGSIETEGYKGHYPKLREKEFLLPPLPEQKKIASILTTVDDVIENTQKQIDKLKDLKKATINELLTKGIGHKNFQDSEIGRLPKNWELKKVSDIADVIDPHPSHRAPSIDLNGIPFIGIGDIEENGNILLSKVRKVSAEIFDEHNKRYKISKITIGFGRVASIGKIIDFFNYNKKILISPTIAIIEPKKIIKTYLINILKSNLMKKQIDYLTTGSTRSSLGIMLIRNLLLPVAPMVEQRKISLVFDSIDEVIKKNVEKIRKINFLKKSLMQDLLTGKVRVRVN